MQCTLRAWSLALASAGINKLARIAIMAMTTSNSIKVNPVIWPRTGSQTQFDLPESVLNRRETFDGSEAAMGALMCGLLLRLCTLTRHRPKVKRGQHYGGAEKRLGVLACQFFAPLLAVLCPALLHSGPV